MQERENDCDRNGKKELKRESIRESPFCLTDEEIPEIEEVKAEDEMKRIMKRRMKRRLKR